MPMMFPGRGMPTMRWRNSPARQMAKITASCKGVLMAGVNVEKGLSLVKMAFRRAFRPFLVEELRKNCSIWCCTDVRGCGFRLNE